MKMCQEALDPNGVHALKLAEIAIRKEVFELDLKINEGYQDRLVPLFLATLAARQQKQTITFRSAGEMLETFGMQQGGSQYRRLVAAFQRIFGATIFFGTDTQTQRALVTHQTRFNFMREARIWYSRDANQELLPGGFENEIVLTDEFFREVTMHSIPTDLEAAKALSCAPAALDLFMWLSYRCFTAKGEERIPIFWRLRFGSAAGKRGLCAAAEVSRAARKVAGTRPNALASLPSENRS